MEDKKELYTEDYLMLALKRLYRQNEEVPCNENELAIYAIKEALGYLYKRSIDRQVREVLGTKEQ